MSIATTKTHFWSRKGTRHHEETAGMGDPGSAISQFGHSLQIFQNITGWSGGVMTATPVLLGGQGWEISSLRLTFFLSSVTSTCKRCTLSPSFLNASSADAWPAQTEPSAKKTESVRLRSWKLEMSPTRPTGATGYLREQVSLTGLKKPVPYDNQKCAVHEM